MSNTPLIAPDFTPDVPGVFAPSHGSETPCELERRVETGKSSGLVGVGGEYGDRLKKEDWEVRSVLISTARELVTRYHYAKGASNTATHLHGLFRKGAFWEAECVGVAWWIPPTRSAAEATHPERWQGVLALSRLVVAPDVPKNACTFLLARSVKLIPVADWPCLVTYADDWRGHTGTIYRASNWRYLGKTGAEETYTIAGVMTARKAGGKTRTRAEMLALGARPEGKHAKHKFVLLRGRRGCGAVAKTVCDNPKSQNR